MFDIAGAKVNGGRAGGIVGKRHAEVGHERQCQGNQVRGSAGGRSYRDKGLIHSCNMSGQAGEGVVGVEVNDSQDKEGLQPGDTGNAACYGFGKPGDKAKFGKIISQTDKGAHPDER